MSRALKIAVADDERDLRDYLQKVLCRFGHQVRAAEDGRQLVGLCRDFAPDVVVADLNMPGLDGLAAAAEVNRERAVPVILISASEGVARQAGAGRGWLVACLAKPVRLAELRAALDGVPLAGGQAPTAPREQPAA
jgi:two-component system, response regulator PdtaR